MLLSEAINRIEKKPPEKLKVLGLSARAQTKQPSKRYLGYLNRKNPIGISKK